MLDESTLTRILEALPRLSIAVVGDLFLDKYLDLDSRLTETSVETGLDAYQVAGVRCYPGAGGTVLNNLKGLGVGNLHAVSVIGSDGEGFELLRALRTPCRRGRCRGPVRPDDADLYETDAFAAAGPSHELNRLDIKNRVCRSRRSGPAGDRAARSLSLPVDAVIVADQVTERNQGVITDAVRTHLAVLADRHPRVVFFADSRSHIGLFRNVLAKPNFSELAAAVGSGVRVRRPASPALATHLSKCARRQSGSRS